MRHEPKSRLIPRDEETSRHLVQWLGLVPDGVSAEDLFAAIRSRGTSCRAFRAAVYMTNERVLEHPAGELLLDAARNGDVELIFDLPAGGMTRALLRELQDCGPSFSSPKCGFVDRSGDRARASFHPKVISLELGSDGERGWVVTVVGSGNLTLGGLRSNDELGVLSVRTGLLSGTTGWPEIDQILTEYRAICRPVTDQTNLPENALAQRTSEGEGFHPTELLRDYQRDAVSSLVKSYSDSPWKDGWRGALLALPPGAGKTVIALGAALQLMERAPNPVRRVLWLSPEPGLARQAFYELARMTMRGSGPGLDWDAYLVSDRYVQRLPDYELLDWKPARLFDGLRAGRSSTHRELVFMGKGKAAATRTLESLAEWPELVIVDEAHHSVAREWSEVLDTLRPRTVFGLTATPYVSSPSSKRTKTLLNRYRLGSKRWVDYFREGRADVADGVPKQGGGGHVAYAVSARAFLAADRKRPTVLRVLAEPTLHRVELRHDGQRVRIEPSADKRKAPHRRLEEALSKLEESDERRRERLTDTSSILRYRARQLEEKVRDPKLFATALACVDEDALSVATKAARSQLVVLFARGTGHAELLGRLARTRGVSEDDLLVVHVADKRTPSMRRHAVRELSRRGRGLLICVDMLSEGTDLRKAETVIITRWTVSERLYWQMLGRGLRGPGSGGTEAVTIRLYDLDFAASELDEANEDVLGRATQELLSELRDAEAHIEELNLDIGSLPTATAKPPNGDSRPVTNNSEPTRWHRRGRMRRDALERLRDIPDSAGGYEVEIKRNGDVKYFRKCLNPLRVLRNQLETGSYRGCTWLVRPCDVE